MSSNRVHLAATRCARSLTSASALALLAAVGVNPSALAAQDDASVTAQAEADADAEGAEGGGAEGGGSEGAQARPAAAEDPLRINLAVTVPRGEVNEAQVKECEDRAEAGEISGEIVVCRRIGEDGSNAYSGGTEAQRRYAEETAFRDAPRGPDLFGIPNHGNAIGIGGVPPPALMIDVEALPQAPAGSDADRIARGLPPLGQDEDLSEEEIKRRREKLGLPPPAFAREED